MDNQYISKLPIPACAVDPDGIVSGANPLIKNVFVYEDIVGSKFFTLTGIKREQLMNANTEERILERNDKLFFYYTLMAAQSGHPRAQQEMYYIYKFGHGTQKDYDWQ